MKSSDKVLNSIGSKDVESSISSSVKVPNIKSSSVISSGNVQSKAVILSLSSKILSLTVAATIFEISSYNKIIDPNDFVNSCYGGGYWVEDYPYSETDAWVE